MSWVLNLLQSIKLITLISLLEIGHPVSNFLSFIAANCCFAFLVGHKTLRTSC